MKRVKPVTLLSLLIALSLLPAVALAQGGDDIPLEPYARDDFGISGVKPVGWAEVASGAYARSDDPADLVLVLQQAARGVTADEIVDVLLPRLGVEALPEEVTVIETEALIWQAYTIEIDVPDLGTVVVDMALSETGGTTYLVLLQTLSEEYEALHDGVFLPGVEAMAPIVYAWGPDEPAVAAAEVEAVTLVPEVLATYDHDTTAYTQGLLVYEGQFYESTGRRGESTVRLVEPETGEVLQQTELEPEFWGEGLALVDDRLIQLTWQSHVAFVYDRETLEQIGTYEYEGEGWGLCYDGEHLYHSDGTPFIDIRDPETFEVLYTGQVLLNGQPITRLNELECVGDTLYANIWQTDLIVQIDKSNGAVVAVIEASGLLTEDEIADLTDQGQDVLNGIAYDPETERMYITGKRWPHLFLVEFVAAPEEDGG